MALFGAGRAGEIAGGEVATPAPQHHEGDEGGGHLSISAWVRAPSDVTKAHWSRATLQPGDGSRRSAARPLGGATGSTGAASGASPGPASGGRGGHGAAEIVGGSVRPMVRWTWATSGGGRA